MELRPDVKGCMSNFAPPLLTQDVVHVRNVDCLEICERSGRCILAPLGLLVCLFTEIRFFSNQNSLRDRKDIELIQIADTASRPKMYLKYVQLC